MKNNAPYCACSTPPGSSGIAVIRVGGEGAGVLLDQMFTLVRSSDRVKKISEMKGYTAAFGYFYDPKTNVRIDDVVCTRFCTPHSYTGEEIIEISCHGGYTVIQEILRVLLENGGRPAEPGEFTKRAFLSGKLDLSQAEAVMDVISAKSELSLAAAGRQLAGGIKNTLFEITQDIYKEFSSLEMLVEFPEHEESPEQGQSIINGIVACEKKLLSLLSTFSRGRILRDGMTVVLAGIPNSGKSSLLNRLAGYERAIVTSLEGTTRDTLEVFVSLGGVPVRVVDTAGIRQTSDEVEKIGVARTMDALEESDILLWLIDENKRDLLPDSRFSEMLTHHAGKREVGLVFSKSDILSEKTIRELEESVRDFLEKKGCAEMVFLLTPFSSVTGEGIELLEKRVVSLYEKHGQGSASEVILTNARHEKAIKTAKEYLSETQMILTTGYSPDMACALLRSAMDSLGEITGETVSDELVNQIFSRFCIGK